jgi:hypothetical protein
MIGDYISKYKPMLKLALVALLLSLTCAQYNEQIANKLCHLTVASYCRKADVEKWACAPCKNSPLVMTNVHTFENSSMDTLGYIGTSTELDAIGTLKIMQFWSSEALYPGTSKIGSLISTSSPSLTPYATTVPFSSFRLQGPPRFLLRLH